MALGQVGSMSVALLGDISDFNRDMDKAGAKVKGFGAQVSATGAKVAEAGKRMSLAITLPLVGFGVAAIKFASDAEEIQSKFDVVFKEFAAQTTEWVNNFAESVNRNATDLKAYAAAFQDTFVPLGFARGDAADLSQALVELTVDLASFNNASEPDVMRDLQSAIVGNVETVRKYGVVLNQAALDQELMNMGIKDGLKTATEAEKAQARLNLIIAGTADAQGDAARTAGSFANQLRGMKSEMKTIGEDIGAILIPQVLELMKKVKSLAEAWAGMSDEQKTRIVNYMLALAAAGPVAFLVGNLAKAVGALTLATQTLTASVAGKAVIGVLADFTAALAGLGTAAAVLGSPLILLSVLGKKVSDSLEGDVEAGRNLGETLRGLEDDTAAMDKAFTGAINGIGALANKYVELGEMSQSALADMVSDLQDIKETVIQQIVDGVPVDEAAWRWGLMVRGVLDKYAALVPGLKGIYDEYLKNGMSSLSELAAADEAAAKAAEAEAQETAQATAEAADKTAHGVERAKDVVVAAAKEIAALTTVELDKARENFEKLKKELGNTAVGSLDYIAVVGKLRKAYAALIAAEKAVEGQHKEVGAGLQDLIAQYEALGLVLTDEVIPQTVQASSQYRDIVQSALVDIAWDMATFYRQTERAEQDHQDKVNGIVQSALDRRRNIEKSDKERREDEQRSFDRRLEDIEIWYQGRVDDGAANTAAKREKLEKERNDRIEAARLAHERRLEDLDTTYTRSIQDNEGDREQALKDEADAYEEHKPKLITTVGDTFSGMVDAIVKSKIEDAISGVIDTFLGLGPAAEKGTAAANAALAGLNPLWLALVPLVLGGTQAGADFVVDMNKWLTDLIYGAGTYDASRAGTVTVQSYAKGGFVPGPEGAPQVVVVHGGEPIGAAGFAEVLDYERMGRAVQAGAYEALREAMAKDAGRPIVVQLADGTRLAQALYDPLTAELARRGG